MGLATKNFFKVFYLEDIMKKILATAVLAMGLVASSFAINIGARGSVNFGLGTSLVGDGKNLENTLENTATSVRQAGGNAEVKKGGNIGGGFAFYSNSVLKDFGSVKLGVQNELAFNFNNGYNINLSAYANGNSATGEAVFYSNTLDLPSIFYISLPAGNMFEFCAGLGPQFSFPLKVDFEYGTSENGISQYQKLSDQYSKVIGNFINFGMVFDLNGKVYFGEKKNIAVVLDARYNLDFTKTKFKETSANVTVTEEAFIRRGLCVSIGGEYRF